jgi:hypothetical protein
MDNNVRDLKNDVRDMAATMRADRDQLEAGFADNKRTFAELAAIALASPGWTETEQRYFYELLVA